MGGEEGFFKKWFGNREGQGQIVFIILSNTINKN